MAEPPSILCVLAYEEGRPPLGPEADPEGWIVFPPLNVSGMLFDTRSVNVQYSVSLHGFFITMLALPTPWQLSIASPVSIQAIYLAGYQEVTKFQYSCPTQSTLPYPSS